MGPVTGLIVCLVVTALALANEPTQSLTESTSELRDPKITSLSQRYLADATGAGSDPELGRSETPGDDLPREPSAISPSVEGVL